MIATITIRLRMSDIIVYFMLDWPAVVRVFGVAPKVSRSSLEVSGG